MSDTRGTLQLPAPMSYRCLVTVNHAYRILFIRNRKAASTTIQQAFNKLCDGGGSKCVASRERSCGACDTVMVYGDASPS